MPTPPSLLELQRDFAAAIVYGAAPALEPWIDARGISPAARLGIYRNAHFSIHVDALAVSFPALQRLVGNECFDGLATRYAASRGNRSGNLQACGADFAAFVVAQPETAPWPWLGEVAKLEWLRQETALAAADVPVAADMLMAALTRSAGECCVPLQAHVRVLSSPVPVLDLWRYAQQPDDTAPDPSAGPQHVLLWRETAQVAMCAITPTQAAFASALLAEKTLPQAFTAARCIDASITPEALLLPLLEHALIRAVIPVSSSEALPA